MSSIQKTFSCPSSVVDHHHAKLLLPKNYLPFVTILLCADEYACASKLVQCVHALVVHSLYDVLLPNRISPLSLRLTSQRTRYVRTVHTMTTFTAICDV